MREEYNSVLSTSAEADKIGRFGRYRYIAKTQISARYMGQADISVYLLTQLRKLSSRHINTNSTNSNLTLA